jgi:6-phosphogluconolactonase
MRNNLIRYALLAALPAMLSCTFSCGGNSKNGGPFQNTYMYVQAGPIAQLRVQNDGTLTPLTPATVGTPYFFNGSLVAVDAGHYLFASGVDGNGNSAISQYVIGSDGTLTPNAIPTFSLVTDELSPFTFTPDGQFAIAPAFITGTCWTGALNTYGLSSSGTLSFVDQTSLPGGECEYSYDNLIVDPSGHFVYALCYFGSADSICEFSMSANGAISLLSPAEADAGGQTNSITVAPNGFLYAVNNGGTVTAFWIDESTGQLANAGSFATGTGTTGGNLSIAFNPAGTYAYVTNTNDNSVTQFTVDASSGALTLNGPDVATGQLPEQIAVDPSGRFAFVANYADRTISQFAISDTGRLTPNGTFSLGAQAALSAMTLSQR